MARTRGNDDNRGADIEEDGHIPYFLRDPMGTLRRRWGRMFLVFVVAAATGTAMVWYGIQPTYLATATVLVSSQAIEGSYLPSGSEQGAFDKISAMVGRTLSTQSLANMIEDLGLYRHMRADNSLTEVAAEMRGSINIEAEASVGPQPYRETARVFTVSFRSDRPDTAAIVANKVADAFVESGIELRSHLHRVATTTLSDRVERAREEVDAREKELSTYRQSNRSALSGDDAKLRGRITELQGELERLRSRYTPLHPEVQNLQEEIDAISGRLQGSASAIGGLGEQERRLAVARQRLLEAESAAADAQLAQSLSVAGGRELATVLDRAEASTNPERAREKFLVVAILGSLGLAVLAGMFFEIRDPVVVTTEQLRDDLGLRILGGVARIR
jgi:uncharacterized protein involved in exopolysaccharide biosynthesis